MRDCPACEGEGDLRPDVVYDDGSVLLRLDEPPDEFKCKTCNGEGVVE